MASRDGREVARFGQLRAAFFRYSLPVVAVFLKFVTRRAATDNMDAYFTRFIGFLA